MLHQSIMVRRAILAFCCLCVLGVGSPKNSAGGEQKGPETVKRQPVLMAQLGHSDWVQSVAMSPDGKQVLTGGFDGTVVLWDAATGKELRRFMGHSGMCYSAAFSPDGKHVLTGSYDKARMWDAATGQELLLFQGHASTISSVAISRNANQVLTGSWDKTARLWDAATGKGLHQFLGHTSKITSVAISPDGKQVLTGSDDTTARLWDAVTGKELCRFQGHASKITSVAISPDGKQVLTGSWDKTARLWEAATGKELRSFQGHVNFVISVAFSLDGKHVLTASSDQTARFWDAVTSKELRRFLGHSGSIFSVAISPDGTQILTGSYDKTARLWEAATGKELRSFQGNSGEVSSVAISPDGNQVLTGSDDKTAQLWDAATGKMLRRFVGHTEGGIAVAMSLDGKRVLTGSYDKTARMWDAVTGKELRSFQGHTDTIRSVAISRDAKQVLTGSWDRTARLWDAATGKEIRRFLGHSQWVQSVAISPDGTQILTGSWDKTARLWEAATGKKLRSFQGHVSFVMSVAFSRDGKQVLTGSHDGTARLWDAATGKELRRFVGSWGGCFVAISPDGKQVLTGYDAAAGVNSNTARLWDTATGKELCRFLGHSHGVLSVAMSPDSKRVLTGSRDSTTRLWDAATGKELCCLISFRDGSWAVIDSGGRFDAANGGKVEGLHWVAGMETIALDQLKERYYDPGLLAKYMGFNKEPLRKVQAFRDVKLHPHVEAKPPAVGSSKLNLKLANRGGGIGKVQVFVNGRELLADARGPNPDPDAATATISVDLAGAVALPGEKNKVRIVTWNADGYLSSRGLDLDWEPPGRKDEQKMELHAIVVGVSTYDADALKLRFAAKDAGDVAKALELGGKRLFGADKTHVTLLCDGAIPPTRGNLEKAFEAARKCRPTDVLVVYLAGHGIALPEQGQEVYCYLTRDARTVNQDAFRDPDLRRQYSLTSTELTEWFKRIPALKQVLILDTCAAGAAAKKLIEHRDVGADQIRAIDRLRDRTGFHVLMGCASDRVSYEASQYSQGLLTYSLLQGMRGAKLREGEFVDVMDLFQYAADQVPQLARNIGGIQKPLILAPRGTSFDIGRLKDDDKKLIPLAQVRPLILRPLLQNADENVLDDDLGLMPLLRKRLIEQGYAARGPGAQAAVYVDADEMPGAIRPTGKYTVEGKTVQARVLLRQDGKTVGVVQVEGTRDRLDMLADRLAAAIAAKLKTP